jgi:cyclohexyl-isocyanide hydratase
MSKSSTMKHLHIGAIVFQRMDQCDFTGPFEVLSRIPGSTFHVIGKDRAPVRDIRGLILVPETTFSEVPPLDLLVVPGGAGQEELMEDEVVLSFIRQQARTASYVFSVCTGTLLCGAAGLLRGVKATTHWSAFHLLHYFGAIPVDARVVIDGSLVSAAGVTAGLDGALRLVSLLLDDRAAQKIQLSIEYSPEPAFDSGSPHTAPPEIVDLVRLSFQQITESRLATAKRIAARLGVRVPSDC